MPPKDAFAKAEQRPSLGEREGPDLPMASPDPSQGASVGVGANPPPKGRTQKLLSQYVHDPGVTKRVLGLEPVLLGRIANLGLPVILGMLTQTAINQIDSVMVGRLPEELAVAGTAALGPSLLLLWFFGGFLSAISVGTQAVTARRFGEGDARGAGRVLTNSIVVALASSVVFTVIAILVVEPFFHSISHDPNVRAAGIEYSRVRMLGLFSMVAMASYKAFYDGIGRVLVHMSIAFAMNFLNALLNYLLIFGNWGFPALGVEGAAWSSVISSVTGLGMMIAWSLRRRDRRTFCVYHLKNLDLRIAGTVMRLSFFSGLATVFVMTGFGLFYAIVGKIDELHDLPGINVSATSIIINITMLVFMTCLAFGTSTATLVSQSLGAKNPGLAERYAWQSVKVMVLVMALVGLIMALFPEALLRLYLPEEAGDQALKDAVIATGAPALRFSGVLAPLAAAALVLTQALYGAGESRFVMVVELFLHFFCLVPLAYLLGVTLKLGLIGCWYAAGAYGAVLALAMGLKFWSGGWKKTVI